MVAVRPMTLHGNGQDRPDKMSVNLLIRDRDSGRTESLPAAGLSHPLLLVR